MLNPKKYSFVVCASLMILGNAGSALAQGSIQVASPGIDKIFSYYSLECSVTQLEPVDGTPGGTGGHALMYIKGACRDTSVGYPHLKICDENADYTDPTTGVAVSVDKIFENTSYVATDGKDFMFNGALQSGQAVDADAMNRTMESMAQSGAFTGVKIHDEYQSKKPADLSQAQYLAKVGADTDYAILFARTASCVFIPMNRKQIEAEVNYINSSNEPYVSGKKTYHWNGLADNCANFTHDVLASAGIRKMVSRSSNIFHEAFNLLTLQMQVPRNETLATEQAVNDLSKIKTADQIYANKAERAIFNKLGTLPQLGGIFHTYQMDAANNTLYKPASGALFLDVPFFKPREKAMEKMLADPAMNDVSLNLKAVHDKLVEVQLATKPASSSDTADYALFATTYNKWVNDSIDDIEIKLNLLSGNH